MCFYIQNHTHIITLIKINPLDLWSSLYAWCIRKWKRTIGVNTPMWQTQLLGNRLKRSELFIHLTYVGFCLFLLFAVCVYTCVWSYVCAHVHICVESGGQSQMVSSGHHLPLFLETRSTIGTWDSLSRPGWQAVPFQHWNQCVPPCQALCVVPADWIQVLLLANQELYRLSHLPRVSYE